MRLNSTITLATLLFAVPCLTVDGRASDLEDPIVESAVEQVVKPMMQAFNIPGLAVGIAIRGHDHVYTYGVSSRASGAPVAGDTLFEIGSASKTLTATLASYAQVTGDLSLSDKASEYLPSLRGSSFDKVSLLNLGTHTPGGLPLQVPDNVTDNDRLMAYFKTWKPSYAPGTYRTYANPGIGMLGMIAAKSMNEDFVSLMERKLLPALGMRNTYINVPQSKMDSYAQGYTKKDEPIRMAPGMLAAEAYGIKASAGDMIRFVEVNMQTLPLDEKWQRAIDDTHTGYFRIGGMTQDLIWEQYSYPADLATLLAGNSAKIAYEANPVTAIAPPLPPQENVWINKTGSTNGFGAYVAFVPGRKIGIVMLANKNYPIEARVTAGYRILMQLDRSLGSKN